MKDLVNGSLVVPMVVAAVLGALMLCRRRNRLEAERARGIIEGLDFTIDLIAVVLGSGGTVRQALAVVAEIGPVAVRPVFADVLRRSASGMLLADGISQASTALGPGFRPLLGALVATERDGAPISILLQRLGDEADQARRWRAEASAKRLPVALLVPLVVCSLPAVVIGAVVPLAVVAVRQLGG